VGIVGLNGAGKSTLLQMAAGVLPPSNGTVRIRGRVAALLELGSGFNPEATGLQNIYLYAATLGLARTQIEQRLDAIVAFSGLQEFLHAPVKTYSTGMQVRLAFSVATSVEPDILIVDEALSVGDGVFAKRSFDRIMQLRDQGTAVLLCSHALFHVDQFCQRTLWLDQGRVRALGATQQVLAQYQEFLDAAATAPDDQSQPPAGQCSPAADAEAATPVGGAEQPFQTAHRPELVRLLNASIALDGQTGPELYGLAHNSLLEVTIALQTSAEEPHPRAAIVISTDSGRIIGTHITPPDWLHATDPARH
jgi:lipopolysaccharide transport system ATP-binding protein